MQKKLSLFGKISVAQKTSKSKEFYFTFQNICFTNIYHIYQIFLDFPFFDIYNEDKFRSEFDSNGKKSLHEFYTKSVKSYFLCVKPSTHKKCRKAFEIKCLCVGFERKVKKDKFYF